MKNTLFLSKPKLETDLKTYLTHSWIRLTAIALFATFLTPKIYGQTDTRHLENITHQSDLIVEGEVIESESFWDDDQTRIYTSNLVEVKTKMKGELRSPYIEVLTVGGQVGDDFLMVSHSISVGKGWKGLLFLTDFEVDGERTTAFRSSENPSYRISDRATYYYDRINPPAVFRHATVKDIEAELLQPLERFCDQPTEIFDNNFQRPSTQLLQAARDFVQNVEFAATPPETAAASTPTTIEYLIANPELTGTWPKYLEFDLKAKCNVPSTDFAKGEIWVNYNIDAFGPSIVGSGYLTWNEESFLATGDYTVFAEDLAVDKVKLKVEHTGQLSLADLNELPVIEEALLHLKIRVNDLTQLADITFDQDSMDEKSKYRGAGRANALYPYDIVLAVDEQAMIPAPSGSRSITFNMANSTVVQDTAGDHWFETDIVAKSSGDSTFWVSSLVSLRVDTSSIAGSFAELDDPNNFELIKAGLSDNPNIDVYPSSSLAENDLVINIRDTIYNISDPNNYPSDGMYLTSTDQLVAKVRMRISQCNNLASVDFYQPNMYNASRYYIDSLGWNYFQFNPVLVGNGFASILCPDSTPVIYSVSPKVITAGTFDTLTIYGANFGSSYAGIYFENADKGPNGTILTWVSPYRQDVVWTDTVIKTTVPSAGLAPGASFAIGSPAGSGVVRLEASGLPPLTFLESDSIEVLYSVMNRRFADTTAVRLLLGDYNGSGGYTFICDSTSVTDSAKAVFEEAILQWNCATKVNFVVDSSNSSLSTSVVDGINSVRFAPSSEFSSSSILAQTFVRGTSRIDTCVGSTTTYLYVEEIDIAFRDTGYWHFDFTTFPADSTTIDMLPVALHEIGHGHLLDHVLESSKIMQYKYTHLNTKFLGNQDVEGGLNVMGLSVVLHCVDNLPMDSIDIDCGGSPNNITELTTAEPDLTVWPNPFLDSFTFSFKSRNYGNIQLELINSIGQSIWVKPDLAVSTGKNEFQVSNQSLPSGIYFLVITKNGERYTQKIIKK